MKSYVLEPWFDGDALALATIGMLAYSENAVADHVELQFILDWRDQLLN